MYFFVGWIKQGFLLSLEITEINYMKKKIYNLLKWGPTLTVGDTLGQPTKFGYVCQMQKKRIFFANFICDINEELFSSFWY